jgi:hypothetical protein
VLSFGLSSCPEGPRRCKELGEQAENRAVWVHLTAAEPHTHAHASMCQWYCACTGRQTWVERLISRGFWMAPRQASCCWMQVSCGSERAPAWKFLVCHTRNTECLHYMYSVLCAKYRVVMWTEHRQPAGKKKRREEKRRRGSLLKVRQGCD